MRPATKLEPQSNRHWARRALLPNGNQAMALVEARVSERKMLDALRSAAGTWVAKALLFLLVVSFVNFAMRAGLSKPISPRGSAFQPLISARSSMTIAH